MLVNLEGYNALTEHLANNLGLFVNQGQGDASFDTVEHIVTDLVANNLMLIFAQNNDLDSECRFQLLNDADRISADLSEVFAGVWHQHATEQQVEFLKEYADLMKNLFDSAIQEKQAC